MRRAWLIVFVVVTACARSGSAPSPARSVSAAPSYELVRVDPALRAHVGMAQRTGADPRPLAMARVDAALRAHEARTSQSPSLAQAVTLGGVR